MKIIILIIFIFFGVFACAKAASANLYSPQSYYAYTSDLKSRKIGDLITIMVYENASATSAANTTLGRDTETGFDIRSPGKSFSGGINIGSQNEGRGRTQREGRVLAQLTVPIKEILAQGDFLIGGEQILEINNERQEIRVEGRVRAQDISDANIVLSTRIGNAKISYVGQGDLADKQRPTWWQRFLSLFGI